MADVSILRCSAACASVVRAPPFAGSAANLADFSRAISLGGTVCNRAALWLFDGRSLDAAVVGKMAADLPDLVGPSDRPLDPTGAFGWRAVPPFDNDAV